MRLQQHNHNANQLRDSTNNSGRFKNNQAASGTSGGYNPQGRVTPVGHGSKANQSSNAVDVQSLRLSALPRAMQRDLSSRSIDAPTLLNKKPVAESNDDANSFY